MSATTLCSLMTYFYNNFHTWEVLYFLFMDIEIEALSNFLTFMILLVEHGFRVRHPDQKTILVFLLICCVSLDKVRDLMFPHLSVEHNKSACLLDLWEDQNRWFLLFPTVSGRQKVTRKDRFCMIRIISMYPGISDSKSQAFSTANDARICLSQGQIIISSDKDQICIDNTQILYIPPVLIAFIISHSSLRIAECT